MSTQSVALGLPWWMPFRRFGEALIKPHPSVEEIGARRQVQLFAALALGLGVTTALGSIFVVRRYGIASESVTIIVETILLFVGYGLVRSRYGRLGVLMLTITASIAGLLIINFAQDEPIPFYATTAALLPNALILASAALSFREMIVLVLFDVVALEVVILTKSPELQSDRLGPLGWVVSNGLLLAVIVAYRDRVERERLAQVQRANDELRALSNTLEQRVANRTRDLEVAGQVAHQTTRVLSLTELLPQIVERTQSAFGLYEAMVFLYDPALRALTLSASTSHLSRPEWAALSLNAPGLIPKAALSREPQLANDVTQNTVYISIPELPNTKAELALPMVVGTELQGVLDLQADMVDRFTLDDVRVLTSLADQLAVAIRNARSYEGQVRVAEELRSLDKLKTQFLASMSHELRTPLNSILNFSQLLSTGVYGAVTDEQREAMSHVTDSGKHLLSLINDVLDIAKIQANMISLFVERDVSLNKELETATTIAVGLLKDKPVELVQQVPANLPLMLGDRRRLRQIFINLLSNACKFTEQGQVVLSAQVQDGQIVVSVQDTGPGISPADQEIIFEPFLQSHAGLRDGSGTGLGLAIARSLVQVHRGRMWLDSELNHGSTFYVALPIHSPELEKMAQT